MGFSKAADLMLRGVGGDRVPERGLSGVGVEGWGGGLVVGRGCGVPMGWRGGGLGWGWVGLGWVGVGWGVGRVGWGDALCWLFHAS